MEASRMKNMVVLRNLPSNLVEEAFIVVKNNKTAKKLEYIDKVNKAEKDDNNKNTNDYIIREAESVISNYVSIVEKKEKGKNNLKAGKKYKMLKYYSVFITIVFIITIIFV